MAQEFPRPTAAEQYLASQPHPVYTGLAPATVGVHPNVFERLLQCHERAESLHRLRVPIEERQETNLERLAAIQRLEQLEAHPANGGFGLHPQDKRILSQKKLIEQLTFSVQRNNDRTQRADALWQPAARVRQNLDNWLRDRPPNTAVEDAPTELPKLNGKEDLLDAIERYRRRGRELQADAHRIRSAPYPSTWAKEQARAQVAALAQRGAPDVTLLVEHGRNSVTWPMETLRTNVFNTERAVVGFAEAPDAVAVMAWAFGDMLIKRLDEAIDADADDANALGHDERQKREAEVLADLLEVERIESALVWAALAQGLPTEHRGDCSPQAVLQCRLITLPTADPSPGTSPEYQISISGPR
jgi:hypothetical protein